MNSSEMSKLCKKISEHLSGYMVQSVHGLDGSSLEIVATKDNRKKTIRMGVSPDGLYLSKIHAENI